MSDSSREAFTVEETTWHGPAGEEVRRIRRTVFIEEQSVPEAEEWEPLDEDGARHFLARDIAGRAVATGRLVQVTGDPQAGRIGRMAVLREARGKGAGSVLMESLIARARALGYRELILEAQTHALGFYERHGFHAHGPEFLDTGIPHRWMKRKLGGPA